jgi:hypothetical protein
MFPSIASPLYRKARPPLQNQSAASTAAFLALIWENQSTRIAVKPEIAVP